MLFFFLFFECPYIMYNFHFQVFFRFPSQTACLPACPVRLASSSPVYCVLLNMIYISIFPHNNYIFTRNAHCSVYNIHRDREKFKLRNCYNNIRGRASFEQNRKQSTHWEDEYMVMEMWGQEM